MEGSRQGSERVRDGSRKAADKVLQHHLSFYDPNPSESQPRLLCSHLAAPKRISRTSLSVPGTCCPNLLLQLWRRRW